MNYKKGGPLFSGPLTRGGSILKTIATGMPAFAYSRTGGVRTGISFL
jgi:hypothetical protein